MTTFADMTREECVECVGMWVRYQTPLGDHLAVYEGENILYEPGCGPFTAPLHTIAPLYDKPRAWNPDGTPPAGEWEDDYTDAEGSTLTTGEDVPGAGPHQHIRRFVGEWEQA